MTNFGVRDRERGTMAPINSSVGAGRKFERIRENPSIALAYHTREHGFSTRSEFVLVQGRGVVGAVHADYPASIPTEWKRFARDVEFGPLLGRWLRVWRRRVEIGVEVQRIVAWPDLACEGPPDVLGPPLALDQPPSQRRPAKGAGPRIGHRRAARRARALRNVLLGWVGADGLPMIAPARVGDACDRGIELRVAGGLVPAGGRRAGLTAHEFARYTFGQRLRKHTGWLEADERGIVYAPHTETGYAFPESRLLFYTLAGAMTRWEARRGRSEAR
jgi:hypothetical protein